MAVVKNSYLEDNYFRFEIGVSNRNKFNFLDIKDPDKIFCGQFPPNVIPKIFPYPGNEILGNNCQKIQSFINDSTSLLNSSSIIAELVEVTENLPDKVLRESHTDPKENDLLIKNDNEKFTLADWICQPIGGQFITNKEKNTDGTMGGYFYLGNDQTELYGITNWHVISGFKYNPGDCVYCGKGIQNLAQLGILTWSSYDLEVAFIKIDESVKNLLLIKYKNNIPTLSIGMAEIDTIVHQRGAGSKNGSLQFRKNRIRSINASIRINDTSYKNGRELFRNKILIEDPFSKSGDSGAVVFSQDNIESPAVGLLFSSPYIEFSAKKDKPIIYSVASHLNSIINQ